MQCEFCFLDVERGGLTSLTSPETETSNILSVGEMPEVNDGNLAGSSSSNSKDSKASYNQVYPRS